MTRRLALRWRPSPLALALGTTSALALTLAVLARRPELIAFTAPLLGALAGGWGWGRPATHVELRVERRTERCFEQERVPVRLRVAARGGLATLSVCTQSAAGLGADAEGRLRAARWGRYPVRARITAQAAGGLLVATAVTEVFEIRVYPRPEPLRAELRPGELLDRLGVHIGRTRGGGLEFAGIRPYLPGDPLVTLNWLASSRLGRPHVTERLAERAADVVALIDIANPPGLDLAVHGATEIVQAALRRGDRAGVLTVGGATPRWLRPDVGRRQFYRIVDTVLDAAPGPGGPPQGSTRIPRAALPPRSFVIVFSPLLDCHIAAVIGDLRGRGHSVLVVDVLRRPDRPPDPLIEQVWRFDRTALCRELASARVPVLTWTEGATLDQALAANPTSLPRRRNRESARGRR